MIRKNTLVACSWHPADVFVRPKNAIGIVRKKISRHHGYKKAIFLVELLHPECFAKEYAHFVGEEMVPIIHDVVMDEVNARAPEAMLELSNRIAIMEREIGLLKQTSGLQFQEA